MYTRNYVLFFTCANASPFTTITGSNSALHGGIKGEDARHTSSATGRSNATGRPKVEVEGARRPPARPARVGRVQHPRLQRGHVAGALRPQGQFHPRDVRAQSYRATGCGATVPSGGGDRRGCSDQRTAAIASPRAHSSGESRGPTRTSDAGVWMLGGPFSVLWNTHVCPVWGVRLLSSEVLIDGVRVHTSRTRSLHDTCRLAR